MYSLRFPFSIPQGKFITDSVNIKQNGLTYSLKKQDELYVLTVDGFQTKVSAIDYLENLKVGFMWLLLHRGLPLDSDAFSSWNGPRNGAICGNSPAIYLTYEPKKTEVALSITSRQEYSADSILDLVSQGANISSYKKIIKDSKLQLAFELYGAFFIEESQNAKFLTLMLAFEALKENKDPTPITLSLIKNCTVEAKKKKEVLKAYDPKSEDINSLETLINNLSNVCKKSLGDAIKHLVSTTLQKNGDQDAEETAKRAKQIYGYRGTLVHTGKLESTKLTQATQDAKNIIERVLKAKFEELAKKK